MMNKKSANDAPDSHRGITRREAIDRLFADLSPWDILYLRRKIRDTTITLATIDDLPLELICAILSYLDFDDYRTCTWVCRKWTALWAQDFVITRAMRQFFPGLLSSYPETPARQVYPLAVKKHLKWRQPHCKHTWIPWDFGASDIFTDLHEYAHNEKAPVEVLSTFLYNKDKLAWQPRPERIIVDDLRTHTRQRFVLPGSAMTGAQCQIAALNDQLLVLLELRGTDRTVRVANLATREWKTLTLPARLEDAFVDSKTVSLVTEIGQILLFTWGGKTVQLDLSQIEYRPTGSDSMFGGVPKVLPHPTQDNVIYAVWVFSHEYRDKRLCSFAVVKFDDGQAVWQATQSIPNPLQNPQRHCEEVLWLALSFTCRRSDNDGTFSLGLYRIQGAEKAKLELCSCCEPRARKGDWGVVTFNVLTETFGHHDYLSPRPDILWDGEPYDVILYRNAMILVDAHLWNNDLLLAATMTDDEGVTDIHMQTVHPVGNHKTPSPQWLPLRLQDPGQPHRTQVFQDDDFVVVPTQGGVALFEPSESRSTGIVGNIAEPSGRTSITPRLSFHLRDMTQMIEIKHEEAGCGLRSRQERRRGHQDSPLPSYYMEDSITPDY